jgi:hypothetical protein
MEKLSRTRSPHFAAVPRVRRKRPKNAEGRAVLRVNTLVRQVVDFLARGQTLARTDLLLGFKSTTLEVTTCKSSIRELSCFEQTDFVAGGF